jgi:hypothetical protein
MNYDDAVQVVVKTLRRAYPLAPSSLNRVADAVVTALVAAGWGELAADRKRLAGAAEAINVGVGHDRSCSCPGCRVRATAARLIRETPEDGP